MIDEDNSQTISIAELKNAMIRFNLNLSDVDLTEFLERIDVGKKGYIT